MRKSHLLAAALLAVSAYAQANEAAVCPREATVREKPATKQAAAPAATAEPEKKEGLRRFKLEAL